MPVLRQLPRWAWFGAAALAFIAGLVNAAGYLGFRHQPISNMTGNASLLGIALGEGDAGESLHWALTIASFVLGAMLSGMIVQQSTLQLGRRYGAALLLESLLLFAAVPLLTAGSDWGLCLASVAVGLQNGMASTYSGMVIRSTHLTGFLTDLGIYLGQLLRKLPVDRLRLRLCLLMVASFVPGSMAGAWLYRLLHERSLLVPAVLTGVFALGYSVYSQRAGARG